MQWEGMGGVLRRREEKYEVGPARALLLREEIARHLPLYEFHPGQPYTHITTLYFDTRERDFFRRAEKHYDDNVKIRVKEYYYSSRAVNGHGPKGEGGGLRGVEGSDRPEPAFQASGLCFVEIKRSVEGAVEKQRMALPKRDLRLLLAGQDVWPAIERLTPAGSRQAVTRAYGDLRRYLRDFTLELTSIVTYRRIVFQDKEDVLRITFDDNLRVYPPLPSFYDEVEALTPEELGRPVRQSDKVILEIKYPDRMPLWLSKVLSHQAARRLSKFTSSVRTLLRDAVPPRSPPRPVAPPGGAAEDTSFLPEALS
jgi:hypothetical protein